MRLLLPTYGARGAVEPLVGPAKLGAQVPACAPPDGAELLACVGVPPVPIGACR